MTNVSSLPLTSVLNIDYPFDVFFPGDCLTKVNSITFITVYILRHISHLMVNSKANINKINKHTLDNISTHLSHVSHLLHFFLGRSLPYTSSTVCFQSSAVSLYLVISSRLLSVHLSLGRPLFSSPVRPCPSFFLIGCLLLFS